MNTTVTERQREILARHANGATLQEVSEQMYLSYITVRKDVEKAKRVLGGSTLGAVTAKALVKGCIKWTGREFVPKFEGEEIDVMKLTMKDIR